MTSEPGGLKDDQDKVRIELHPFDALNEIAKVWTFGAKKYSDRNWERGFHWSRPFGACMRHLWAWFQGETYDEETGISHLAHAGCCILMLIAFELRGTGIDDRPHTSGPQKPSEEVDFDIPDGTKPNLKGPTRDH